MGNKLDYLSSTQNKLRELRKNINVWNESKKDEQINQILTEFKAAIKKTGKENYTYYEDNSIEYTGPNEIEINK